MRFTVQNLVAVCWNYLGRPIAWVVAHLAISAKSLTRFAYTSVKAFLHGVFNGLAQTSHWIGGWFFYHVIRPTAVFSAKAALYFIHGSSYLTIAGFQTIYVVSKLTWHFVLNPIWSATKYIAQKAWNASKFIA